MKKARKIIENMTAKAVRAVAMTTVSSTTRYLAYQPKKDQALAEKYLRK